MNVVITLPQDMWCLMLEGRKTAEIRKTLPMHFVEGKDVVFINLKGHNKIVGYLSEVDIQPWLPQHWMNWSDVEHTESDSMRIGERCGVPTDWIRRYLGDKTMLWAWCFDEVHRLDQPIDLCEIVPSGKAPQSYVYTDYRL